MFLNNNWILLEFLKTFIKVSVWQVFVNVWQNFIFSGHHVWQILKNFLQPWLECEIWYKLSIGLHRIQKTMSGKG